MSTPLGDIFAQNAKKNSGEDEPKGIEKHAADWIKVHQKEFNV